MACQEEAWDAICLQGILLTASPPMPYHVFKNPGKSGRRRTWCGGGFWSARRGARSRARSSKRWSAADLDASTGVELSEYEATPAAIKVAVRTTLFWNNRIQFIGNCKVC